MMAKFLALLTLGMSWASPEYELKFAAIFLRHGARAPLRNMVPDGEQVWDYGFGQLTPSGQRENYLLGRAMRKYFIEEQNLISPVFNQSQVYIRSSSSKRTIMSVQSLALGFFFDTLEKLDWSQLGKEKIWTPPSPLTIPEYVKQELKKSAAPFDIPPLPIRTFHVDYDKMLLFQSCPRYNHLRDSYYGSPKFKAFFEKNKRIFHRVCSLMNVDCSKAKKKDMFFFVDYFLSSEFDGQFPQLSANPELLKKMEQFYASMLVGELTMDDELNTIAFSNFSSIFPQFLNNTVSNPTNAYKLAIFSTHDSTIFSHLLAYNITNEKFYETIPFSSHIVLELKKMVGAPDGDPSKYIINATFNGEVLFIKSLQSFVEEIKKRGDLKQRLYEEVCALDSLQTSNSSQSTVLSHAFLTIVLLLFLFALGYLIFWPKKRVNSLISDPILQTIH